MSQLRGERGFKHQEQGVEEQRVYYAQTHTLISKKTYPNGEERDKEVVRAVQLSLESLGKRIVGGGAFRGFSETVDLKGGDDTEHEHTHQREDAQLTKGSVEDVSDREPETEAYLGAT